MELYSDVPLDNMTKWLWNQLLIFIFMKYRNDVRKLCCFSIIFQYHKIQAVTEDSHISPRIEIHWKYIDIQLKVPRTPNYEKKMKIIIIICGFIDQHTKV